MGPPASRGGVGDGDAADLRDEAAADERSKGRGVRIIAFGCFAANISPRWADARHGRALPRVQAYLCARSSPVRDVEAESLGFHAFLPAYGDQYGI